VRMTDEESERYAEWYARGFCGDCGCKLPADLDEPVCPFCGLDLIPF
jgi:hypothetical protein